MLTACFLCFPVWQRAPIISTEVLKLDVWADDFLNRQVLQLLRGQDPILREITIGGSVSRTSGLKVQESSAD